MTEIYDYIRLLYARVGKPYCPYHGIEIESQTVQQMVDRILELEERTKFNYLHQSFHIEKEVMKS